MWSLVRPVLICDVRNFREENKVKRTNETFRFFIDLFAFLSSIVVGEFCSVIFAFFMAP